MKGTKVTGCLKKKRQHSVKAAEVLIHGQGGNHPPPSEKYWVRLSFHPQNDTKKGPKCSYLHIKFQKFSGPGTPHWKKCTLSKPLPLSALHLARGHPSFNPKINSWG